MSPAAEREPVVDLGQDGVLLLERDVELLAEDLGVEEVLDPEADPRRLVRVGRADAALGRAQGVLAEEALGHPVELLVVRHDQVRVAAHHEAAGVDALGGQRVELLEQHRRVDHDAVADDRRDVVVEDAARHQLQREGLAVHDDAVAGVVATLVAHDHVHLASEMVGQLALPLVAPLGPDHHGCGHASSPFALSGLRTSVPSRPLGPRGRMGTSEPGLGDAEATRPGQRTPPPAWREPGRRIIRSPDRTGRTRWSCSPPCRGSSARHRSRRVARRPGRRRGDPTPPIRTSISFRPAGTPPVDWSRAQ